MVRNKYQCDICTYYWETKTTESLPEACPVCSSQKIHRAKKHRRFAKKSRPKIRRSFSIR
ncbi:MAG: hypothetical protein V3V72_02480 [Ignavibacteriaceae bacterium]